MLKDHSLCTRRSLLHMSTFKCHSAVALYFVVFSFIMFGYYSIANLLLIYLSLYTTRGLSNGVGIVLFIDVLFGMEVNSEVQSRLNGCGRKASTVVSSSTGSKIHIRHFEYDIQDWIPGFISEVSVQ